MLRIISYIILGILLAQSCAGLKGPNAPIEKAESRNETPADSTRPDKCSDQVYFGPKCLNKISAIYDKPT